MYFPVGWPKYLTSGEHDSTSPIRHIVSSCDRMLFAVVSDDCLSLWYSKPCVKIVSHFQSTKITDKLGSFVSAEWKPDSTMIAVITSKCQVVFFRVEIDVSVPNHHCLYVQHEGKTPQTPRFNINGILDSDSVPAIKLILETSISMNSKIACCLCVRDEIVVSTVDGFLNRLKWNGDKNEKATLHLGDIPVSGDLQQFRASKLTENDGHAVDMEYSPTLGGYSLVLSSGKALFLIPPSSRTDRTSAHGVRAQDLNDVVTLAVNHRYRLIAFGCKSGEGIVYTIDEAIGALEVSHKLIISSKEFPDVSNIAGQVCCMKWTPDGTALALTWQNGGFSLWSVFGALLVCTLGGDYAFLNDSSMLYPSSVQSLEWGLEGYHLWMVCAKSPKSQQTTNGDLTTPISGNIESELIQFQFVKSALSVNPCAGNHEHVFLQGEDKLYMSTSDTVSRNSPQLKGDNLSNIDIGNKNWQVIPISHNYTATNWPIRYSAVDRAGQCIAVAGKTGFAHYALFHRKWKLFGNETQERDMVVSGGITWWKDFICLSCYNIPGQQDEIRFYPRSSKLDNTFAHVTKVPSQVLLLNTFRDTLIIFCADSHVMLFGVERKNTHPNPSVIVQKIQEVSLNNFIPHPLCVAGLTLTSLTSETSVNKSHLASKEAESMLLNVSGKLLMFQRDRTGQASQREERKHRPLPFYSPSVVATSVENIWATSKANLGKMQLMEALWLGCGAHGMKVWLPLYPRNGSTAHNFMSKRIMLPFNVDIYPLAVLFEDAVILGAASDAMFYENSLSASSKSDSDGGKISHLPYCILERTSQIYLQHILRQLLRRNLGFHALDLARCCTELPYFPHVLELLLHGVLEAEATSKAPIPDPLLPRIVAFIQEFPEFLQTVVHCARKTEVALWPYLFSVVGNPRDLFEECLKIGGKLETAASYLIILQNLEKPKVSRQHATLLLEASLENNCWELCHDLVRFLQAIDPNDVESPPTIGSFSRMSSSSNFSPSYPSPPITPTDNGSFNYSNVSNIGRVRTSSMAGDSTTRDAPKPKLKHTVSDSQVISGKKAVQRTKSNEPSAEKIYIDMILGRHARKLLSSNQIRTLGYFSANMQGFQLVSWLQKERVRAAKLEDFVTAVRDIHSQFEWPFPILTYTTYNQMRKGMAISASSLASSSFLDEDLLSSPNDIDKVNGTESSFVMSSIRPPSESFTFMSQSQSDDVLLRPQISKTEDSSIATMEISDSSSLLGEYEMVNDSIIGCEQQEAHDLEIMTQEMANRGPPQSDIELRYLLQIFLEAGCLEWALVIAIVLRDTLGISRTVNTASLTDTQIDMVARMREGLSYLELWADTECVGYKPFFHSIRNQIQVLAKISEQTVNERRSSVSPKRDSPTFELEDGNTSPVTQNIRSEIESSLEQESVTEEKQSDCSIS